MSCNNTTCSPPKDVEFSIRIGEQEKELTSVSVNNQVLTGETGKPQEDCWSSSWFPACRICRGAYTCVFPMIPMTVAFFSRVQKTGLNRFLKRLFSVFDCDYIFHAWNYVSLTSAGAVLPILWVLTGSKSVVFYLFIISRFHFWRFE